MAATNGAHFDFIVVSGGTAGNPAAGRLAENPNVTILVAEAANSTPANTPANSTSANSTPANFTPAIFTQLFLR